MRTLVIVDMQPRFSAAQCDHTTKNVIDAIGKAKAEGASIVVLEYVSYGPTRDDIMEAIGEYEKCAIKVKNRDGGGAWVIEALDEMGVNADLFSVCGVNTACCVHDTAMDLLRHGRKVELIKNACNQPDWWSSSQNYIIDRLAKNGVMIAA